MRTCTLKQFTLSALRTEIAERRFKVKSLDLGQERKLVNHEERSVTIDDDEDFENIFVDAAQQGLEVVVAVVAKKR